MRSNQFILNSIEFARTECPLHCQKASVQSTHSVAPIQFMLTWVRTKLHDQIIAVRLCLPKSVLQYACRFRCPPASSPNLFAIPVSASNLRIFCSSNGEVQDVIRWNDNHTHILDRAEKELAETLLNRLTHLSKITLHLSFSTHLPNSNRVYLDVFNQSSSHHPLPIP